MATAAMPLAVELCRRWGQLKTERGVWDSHCEEIAERFWPDAADFISERTQGEKRAQKVFDATPAQALEKFSAVLESLLTPRTQTWHRLHAKDPRKNEDREVKEWFDQATDWLFAQRASPEGGFYSQAHLGYKSLGAFGSSDLFVEERPGGGIRYKNYPVSQVWIACDHLGRVDTLFRRYKLSHSAAMKKWDGNPKATLPARVREQVGAKPDDELEYLHVVMPNPDYVPGALGVTGMRFAAYEVCVQEKIVIEASGYHEFPHLYSRYTMAPGEKYGRSPAMLVLPTVKTLQSMMQTHLRAGHKVANPPLLLHSDGVLGQGSLEPRLHAGGLNFGGVDDQGRPLIQPLHTGARLDITFEMMQEQRELIQDVFLVRLFTILVETPQMTATEALLRSQEKGVLLAPTVGRQQSEMLGPMIEREVAIGMRQGMLPEPPESLLEDGGQYEIEYQSMATTLQRTEELVAIQRLIETGTSLYEQDPYVFDIIKSEEVMKRSAMINGVPAEILRTDEELEEKREQRQTEEQVGAASEAAPAGAKALRDLAAAQRDFAEIPPEGPPG